MKNYFSNRISLLRDKLSLQNGEAFFTSTREDVLYLTNFNSTNSNLIITKNLARIFTDRRYSQQVKDIVQVADYEFIEKNLQTSLKNFCNEFKIHTIYFEPSKLNAGKLFELRKESKIKFKPLKKFIADIFAYQDEFSIIQTKKAVRITEKIFNDLLKEIKEGISERDFKAQLKYLITKLSDGETFDPIVLFGKNTSFPHGMSSNLKLKKNLPVLIDFGVNIRGYNSDFTRMIYFGNPPVEFIKHYNIVKDALHIAIEKIEVNKKAKEIAESVINYFSRFGLEKYFTHSLGHGLGVYLHNFPSLSMNSKQTIPDNVVLAIEPALYFENNFGIRIEQNILLYQNKKIILNKVKDELIVI